MAKKLQKKTERTNELHIHKYVNKVFRKGNKKGQQGAYFKEKYFYKKNMQAQDKREPRHS